VEGDFAGALASLLPASHSCFFPFFFFLFFFFFTFIHFFPLSPTTFCFLLSLKVVRRYRVAHEVYLIAVSISLDLIALSALLSPV